MELTKSLYPTNELLKLESLGELFESWKSICANSSNDLLKSKADEIVWDGFYPNYFGQIRKILFIGRESYTLSGYNYLDIFFKSYRTDKSVGDKHLNQHFFHARMLHIAWGLLNNIPDWEEIPWASKIGDLFGSESGISFAFMNLCKISNESGETNSDFAMIDTFCQESTRDRNFIEEEVALLEPDIVITMNLGDRLKYLGDCKLLERKPDVSSYELIANGHKALLLDCWHFSATKSHVDNYYQPICEAVNSHFSNP